MNTRAGWKFQGRNPASDPASTAHSSATSGLDGHRRDGDDAQGQGRDERHARRQPVEAVDPVDAVDHAHDPERREQDGHRLDDASPEVELEDVNVRSRFGSPNAWPRNWNGLAICDEQ